MSPWLAEEAQWEAACSASTQAFFSGKLGAKTKSVRPGQHVVFGTSSTMNMYGTSLLAVYNTCQRPKKPVKLDKTR